MSREVLDLLSGRHCAADVTLGLGEVVHDYLAEAREGGGLSGFAVQAGSAAS